MKEQFNKLPKKQRGRLYRIYTGITTETAVEVPTDVNILINDVYLDKGTQQQISSFINKRVVWLQADELTPPVQTQIDSLDDGTIIIFPKNGGLKVKDNLNANGRTTCSIRVSRKPEDLAYGRIVSETEQLLDWIQTLKPQSLQIVDDVVATGATVREIKRTTEQAVNTTFAWAVTCWLMRYPEKTNLTPSGIYTFDQATAALVYAGQSGRHTPVNSVSTWIQDEEKGETVLKGYARKYTLSPQAFVDFINQLK
jgi:hypothetical protein